MAAPVHIRDAILEALIIAMDKRETTDNPFHQGESIFSDQMLLLNNKEQNLSERLPTQAE